MSLARALGQLQKFEEREALETLLQVWRKKPAAPVSELIEKLSAHVFEKHSAAAAASANREALQREWMALASPMRAADVPRLLALLTEASDKQAEARVWVLHSFPRDPRIAEHILRLLSDPPFRSARRFWRRALEVLLIHADRRLLQRLDALQVALPELVGTRPEARHLLSQLRSFRHRARLESRLTVEETAAVEEMQRLVGRAAMNRAAALSREEELLQAVYAEPYRDEPRMVYADCLTERGDPRGEFIMLQLEHQRGHMTLAQLQREKALLAEHARAWLGPLGKVVQRGGVIFERGFVVACKVAAESHAQVRALHGHPAWSTVRHLHLHTALADELFSPALRSLERVTGMRYASVERLCKSPDAWPHLVALSCTALDGDSRDHPGERARRAFVAASPIGQLRELSFAGEVRGPAALRWLWTSENGKRLERFTSFMGLSSFAGWASEKLPPALVELVRWHPDFARGWVLVLRPWEGILNATWAGEPGSSDPVGELALALRAVKKGSLTEVRVHPPRRVSLDVERLQRAAHRLGATLKLAK